MVLGLPGRRAFLPIWSVPCGMASVRVVRISRPEKRNLIDGGTQRLPRIVGLGRALEMILTGREIDAQEAREMGLANRVVPDGSALEAAVELAEQIAAFPWTCVVRDRQSVYEGLGESLEEGLALEARNGEPVVFADGFADGVAKFRERDRRS